MKECKCMGCQCELEMAYELQQMGYAIELDFYKGHVFFRAYTEDGDWVAG